MKTSVKFDALLWHVETMIMLCATLHLKLLGLLASSIIDIRRKLTHNSLTFVFFNVCFHLSTPIALKNFAHIVLVAVLKEHII